MKKYKNGMYGGKFMPFHKGHLSCIAKASEECEVVNLILFYNGIQEQRILREDHREFLTVPSRWDTVLRVAQMFPNVRPIMIDVSPSIIGDVVYGYEDWHLQTPMILRTMGMPDAVYGSEPAYAKDFELEYPNAVYRVIDIDRKLLPISGTKVRHMSDEEMKEWIV